MAWEICRVARSSARAGVAGGASVQVVGHLVFIPPCVSNTQTTLSCSTSKRSMSQLQFDRV
jgi:hypothetical protein